MTVRHSLRLSVAVIALSVLAPVAAPAQTSAVEELLRQILRAFVENGSCPADLFDPPALEICQSRLAEWERTLAAYGDPHEFRFVGSTTTLRGPAEIYAVGYEMDAAVWTIGVGPDGKVTVLYGEL